MKYIGERKKNPTDSEMVNNLALFLMYRDQVGADQILQVEFGGKTLLFACTKEELEKGEEELIKKVLDALKPL